MLFNVKKTYFFLALVFFWCHITVPAPLYLPLFIRILWNNLEWKTTCESLEKNDQYQQLKTKLGSNIEKLILPTSVAQSLVQDDKMYLKSTDYLNCEYIIDELEMQLKLNNFLTEENFEHFEPAQKYYLSEINGNLLFINSKEKNISELVFGGKYKNSEYLSPEKATELIDFIEQTGYVYRENMAEDTETHRLHNWYNLSSDDFKYTDSLKALADFARKQDQNYRNRGDNNLGFILDKEGMDKLKERIFELTKKCVHPNKTFDSEFFKECYIIPLSEVKLPE